MPAEQTVRSMGPDVHVFVSYARQDGDRATQLITDLGQLSDRVWFDSHVTGGQRWWDTILDQIQSCTLFVLAVSTESLQSEWCRLEAEWARTSSVRSCRSGSTTWICR